MTEPLQGGRVEAPADRIITDGILIVFEDGQWEIWCGADGENIINAHLLASAPARDEAIAQARSELSAISERLRQLLPAAASQPSASAERLDLEISQWQKNGRMWGIDRIACLVDDLIEARGEGLTDD